MAHEKMSFDTVREFALSLPDVQDATTTRGFALKLRGRLLACQATHKSAEPDSLVVRMDIGERDRLVAESSDTCYVTGHYVKHPSLLVRLARIDRSELQDLIGKAWRYQMEHR
jgi:hypothetical protein